MKEEFDAIEGSLGTSCKIEIDATRLYFSFHCVRKLEANPNYGNHPRGGGVNKVMVSFCKFKQVKIRDNYMQIYNKQNKHSCI